MKRLNSTMLFVIAFCFCLKAVAANPAFDQAVNSYKSGKYSQALSQFETFSKCNPADVMSHYYMALCYQGMNQFALASQQFQWVARYSPESRLRQMAQVGLNQLSQAGGRRNYTPTGYSLVSAKGPAPTRVQGAGSVSKVLEFYTTWCGVCKRFEPVFDETKSKFNRSISFEQLDAEDSANEGLVQRYNIKAYPTLVFLDRSGNVLLNKAGAPRDVESFAGQLAQFGAAP